MLSEEALDPGPKEPSSTEEASEPLRLKFHYKREIRVVAVARENSVSYRALKQRLTSDYGFEFKLAYQDVDGDFITLASQNDLNELLAQKVAKTVNVRVSPATLEDESSQEPTTPFRGKSFRNLIAGPTPVASGTLDPLGGAAPFEKEKERTLQQHRRTLGPLHTNKKIQPESSSLKQQQSPPPSNNNDDKAVAVVLVAERPLITTPLTFASLAAQTLSATTTMETTHFEEECQQRTGRTRSERAQRQIRWQRGQMIGQGAFGKVYMALNLDTGELMAMKQLDSASVSTRERSALENEISMMRGLSHPNIVRYLGVDVAKDLLAIFLEYVPGGSLRSLLDRFGKLEEVIVRLYSRQILFGLEYLHANGIAHRDIKAANVLVSNDGSVKLADFGASKRIAVPSSRVPAAVVVTGGGAKGTPLWMAPEVIKERPKAQGWRKADVWSVGCTVIEMSTGKPPWSQYSNAVTAMYHIACVEELPDLPKELSEDGHDFLVLCFQRDPKKRPECSSLLLQPFAAFAPTAWRENKNDFQMLFHRGEGLSTSGAPHDLLYPSRPSTTQGGLGARRSATLRVVTDPASLEQRRTPKGGTKRMVNFGGTPVAGSRSLQVTSPSDSCTTTPGTKKIDFLLPLAAAAAKDVSFAQSDSETIRKEVDAVRRDPERIIEPSTDTKPFTSFAKPTALRTLKPSEQSSSKKRGFYWKQHPLSPKFAATLRERPHSQKYNRDMERSMRRSRRSSRGVPLEAQRVVPILIDDDDDDDEESPRSKKNFGTTKIPPLAAEDASHHVSFFASRPVRTCRRKKDECQRQAQKELLNVMTGRRRQRRRQHNNNEDDDLPFVSDGRQTSVSPLPPPCLDDDDDDDELLRARRSSPTSLNYETADDDTTFHETDGARSSIGGRSCSVVPESSVDTVEVATFHQPSSPLSPPSRQGSLDDYDCEFDDESPHNSPHHGVVVAASSAEVVEDQFCRQRDDRNNEKLFTAKEEEVKEDSLEIDEALVLQHGAAMTCLCAASGFVAVGSADGAVYVVDASDAKVVSALDHTEGKKAGNIGALCLGASERLVTGFENDGYVWNYTGTILHKLQGHEGKILSARSIDAFSSSSEEAPPLSARKQRPSSSSSSQWADCVLTTSADHTVRLWDVRMRRPQAMILRGHTDSVNCLQLDLETSSVWTASNDTCLRAWDLRSGRCRFHLTQHFGSVKCLVYDKSLDSNRGGFLSGARDTSVHLWAKTTGTCVRALRAQRGFVQDIALSVSQSHENLKNSKTKQKKTPPRIACATTNGKIRIWDHHNAKCLKALVGHTQAVTCVKWVQDDSLIVSGSSDSTLRLWKPHTGMQLRALKTHTAPVVAIHLEPQTNNTTSLFSASTDGSLRVNRITRWEGNKSSS